MCYKRQFQTKAWNLIRVARPRWVVSSTQFVVLPAPMTRRDDVAIVPVVFRVLSDSLGVWLRFLTCSANKSVTFKVSMPIGCHALAPIQQHCCNAQSIALSFERVYRF
jgi:hypothetical protein